MINPRKYMTTIGFLIGILMLILVGTNIFINRLTNILSIIINITIFILLIVIIFSSIVTYSILNNKKISSTIMKLNFNIVSVLYPALIVLGNTINIPKNEIRKVYIKLNNEYIYSKKFNLKAEDILI